MKKLLVMVLTVVLAFSAAASVFAAGLDYGDVNGDGQINSSDALMVLRSSVGVVELSKNEKLAADVDANGAINSTDALLILKYSVGSIDVFPAEESGDPDVDHGTI